MKSLIAILAACIGISTLQAHNHHKSHHKTCHTSRHCKDSSIHCGPNRLQASPKLTSAESLGCDVLVRATLKSAPWTEFLIQFFDSPTSHGKKAEGKTLLGQTIVKTDDEGVADIHAVVSCICACGKKHSCKAAHKRSSCQGCNQCSFISATATRLRNETLGDTSKFSKAIKVSSQKPKCDEHGSRSKSH